MRRRIQAYKDPEEDVRQRAARWPTWLELGRGRGKGGGQGRSFDSSLGIYKGNTETSMWVRYPRGGEEDRKQQLVTMCRSDGEV